MEPVMHEFKQGTLEASSGDTMTEGDQPVAMSLSEASDVTPTPTASTAIPAALGSSHRRSD